jgi:hypothetical protein
MSCFTHIVDWEVQEKQTGEHQDFAKDGELPQDIDENQMVEKFGIVSTPSEWRRRASEIQA